MSSNGDGVDFEMNFIDRLEREVNIRRRFIRGNKKSQVKGRDRARKRKKERKIKKSRTVNKGFMGPATVAIQRL